MGRASRKQSMTLAQAYEAVRSDLGFPGHVALVEGEVGPLGQVLGVYLGPDQTAYRPNEQPGPCRTCVVGYVPAVAPPDVPRAGRSVSITIWGIGATWEEAIAVARRKWPRRSLLALTMAMAA